MSVSVKGPCHEHEDDNNIAVPLGAPECVGHRANVTCGELENCLSDDGYTSGASDLDLTDSSSEDETAIPGGRVRRMVRGIEKFRRVRRSRRRRPIAPITRDIEDECHTLDRHDSDDDDVDDLFPSDYSMARASFSIEEPLGNSSECKEGLPSLGSPLQELVPDAQNQRDIF